MTDPRSELCELTDLPVEWCGCKHHRQRRPTVVSISALEKLAGHPLPAYRAINLDAPNEPFTASARPLDRVDGQADHWCTCCGRYPRSRDRWLCDWCAEQWVIDLRNVPPLADDLELAKTRRSVMEEQPGKSADEPLPFDDRAARALRRLNRSLAWIADALEVRIYPWQLDLLTRVLLDQHRDISRRQDAPDLADTLRRAVRRGMAVIDRPRPTVYLGACSVCGLALHAPDGVDTHKCACGAIYVVATALAERRAAISEMLVTWPELIEASPAPRSTLYRWRKEGKLRPANQWMGRPVYRYGDALDLRDGGEP